ncbi:MAG: hypothetical protein WD468_02055 [Pirellulales bacterium]
MARDTTSGDSAPLARLFWMMIGPLLLFILAFANVMNDEGWLTAADIGFFVVLLATVYARWREFRSDDGRTAEGEPATAVEFRRYVVLLVGGGVAVWLVANLLGNYWLAG